MTDAGGEIAIVESVAALTAPYDAWVCDIWGVLHNGVMAHQGAVAAAKAFRARGGTVVLVTNAPRPQASVAEQLTQLGIGHDAYDAILTSGDVTRGLIEPYAGRPITWIGPERNRGIFAGVDVRFADPAAAEAVVCSGLYDDTRETPESYRAVLAALAARKIPMICANPDLSVDRGGTIVPCAGAVAAFYETLGGRVAYAGKPYLPIYDRAFAAIASVRGSPPAREKILAIGDGVDTDIKGAAAAGIQSLYIASAIHLREPLSQASLSALFAGRRHRPMAAQAALAW